MELHLTRNNCDGQTKCSLPTFDRIDQSEAETWQMFKWIPSGILYDRIDGIAAGQFHKKNWQ